MIRCLRFMCFAFILWQKLYLGQYLVDNHYAGLQFGEGNSSLSQGKGFVYLYLEDKSAISGLHLLQLDILIGSIGGIEILLAFNFGTEVFKQTESNCVSVLDAI